MTIKGGARQETIFHTVRIIMARGATIDQAIKEVESILRCQLPKHIKALIRQECG